MKFRAKKTLVDNILFDSKTEAARYQDLKLMQRAGDISKLQCHPTFTFVVHGLPVAKYTPDFSYHDKQDRVVIEDVKGWKKSPRTGKLLPRVNREFGLKKKLMLACFGLEVKVV